MEIHTFTVVLIVMEIYSLLQIEQKQNITGKNETERYRRGRKVSSFKEKFPDLEKGAGE